MPDDKRFQKKLAQARQSFLNNRLALLKKQRKAEERAKKAKEKEAKDVQARRGDEGS